MKIIGITGGVGAGKSEVLSILKNISSCFILRADELAKSLEKKGEVCYAPITELLGDKILDDAGEIVPALMSRAIFENPEKDYLKKVNDIIHPRVKERIISLINEAEKSGQYDFFFLEAALLIEDGYEHICDELWYIFADAAVRKRRLKEIRGYSDAKSESIMKKQLDDATFRKSCSVVIDNSGSIKDTEKQLMKVMRERFNCG